MGILDREEPLQDHTNALQTAINEAGVVWGENNVLDIDTLSPEDQANLSYGILIEAQQRQLARNESTGTGFYSVLEQVCLERGFPTDKILWLATNNILEKTR